ncbi:MAG: PepSY-associated TM helix domain-containing protein [Micavibrio sp.]|nr:PepSY-associated TM helix domain-containing protein [Micavibrio sp.]
MITASRVRFWYRIHKWTSLVCTAFLLMECLTGLPLIFGDEIFDSTHPNREVRPANLPPTAPYARLDDMIQASYHLYPGQKILSVGFDDDEPRVFLTMSPHVPPAPKSNEAHNLIFDAHTGKLLEDKQKQARQTEKFDLMGFIGRTHFSLFLNLPGRLFLATMALTFLVALISGVLVYGPFMRRLDFGTVRVGRTRRLKWFDLHNLLGIVVMTWACVVGATGVMNDIEGPLFDLWRAQALPPLLKPYRGKPMPSHLASVDAAVKTTKKALPGMEITSIGFPNPKTTSRHYVIWTRGDTEVTRHLFTPALIDAETGQLVSSKGLPWYLRVLEVSRPLHFGDYGGIPLKIIWAFFDVTLIAVLLSGLYLWLSRRKTPVEDELDRLVKQEQLIGVDQRTAAGLTP